MAEEIIVLKSDYIASAVSKKNYPEEILPAIAFIGRSNVGKSSLINSLTRRKNLAHISQTPGKTQTINFYKVTLKINSLSPNPSPLTTTPSPLSPNPFPLIPFYLVDLPGYGYAKTSKDNRKIWAKFIEEFLLTNSEIKFVCQLVDSRHDLMESDLKFFNWLVEKNLPVLIVATKTDKLNRSERQKNFAAIKKSLGIEEISVLPYSSKTHEGRSELLDVIADSLIK